MSFPFTIKYKTALQASLTPEMVQESLRYIQIRIRAKKADNIVIENNHITYKGTTSNSRTALFGIRGGTFTIVTDADGKSYMMYEIKVNDIVIVGLVAGCLFGLLSFNIWIGIGALFWVGGVNWAICAVRHDGLANDLAVRIDRLHGVKKQVAIEAPRSEELKHWM